MELLLISHRGVASGMKAAAKMILAEAADNISVLELTEEGVEKFANELEEKLTSWLTEGTKGLVLADLKGGTPYNQAEMILSRHNLKHQAKVIGGMNLPLVMDALFRDFDPDQVDEIREMIEGARNEMSCLELLAAAVGDEDE